MLIQKKVNNILKQTCSMAVSLVQIPCICVLNMMSVNKKNSKDSNNSNIVSSSGVGVVTLIQCELLKHPVELIGIKYFTYNKKK